MCENSSDNFYQDLEGFSPFERFANFSNYEKAPDDWYISIADVENSTELVNSGRYKDVNAIGAACIAAVVNAVKPIMIPFVFGGDGASFCYPPSCKTKIESALVATQLLANENFSASLIAGTVSVSFIRRSGREVYVAKYRPSVSYQQAMFSGNGMTFAEELIKKNINYRINKTKITPNGSFEGFECRWNEILSPKEETLSIIIQSLVEISETEKLYTDINNILVTIFGKDEDHHPINNENLKISFSIKKLAIETKIRVHVKSFLNKLKYFVKVLILNFIGKRMMDKNINSKNTNWGQYKDRLISNTDYRKFDDTLRMVISGTTEQKVELEDYLQKLYKQNKIAYGIHSSKAALLTCLIEDYDTKHIHFLDGSDGGYTFAAKKLKQQLREKI